MKIKILSLLFCLLNYYNLPASISTDSLLVVNSKTKKDSIKGLLALSESYRAVVPQNGLKLALKALELSKIINDTTYIIESGYQLALLQKEIGLKSTALSNIIQAKELADHFGIDSLIAHTQLVAGHIYSSLKKYDVALQNYNSCLKFYQNTNDSVGMSYTYSGLGIVYYDQKKYKKALFNYLNAEAYWATKGLTLKADLWNNIGALYLEIPNYKKAEKYYLKALDYYAKEKWYGDMSMVYYNLGEMYLNQNNFNKSDLYFYKSLSLGRQIRSPTEIMWANHGLYLSAKKANNPISALAFYEKQITLKDSLADAQNKADVLNLEARYNKKKQTKEIEHQKLQLIAYDNLIEYQKNRNLSYFIVSAFLILIVLIILFFLKKYRTKNNLLTQQKKIINKSLEEKEILLKEIHHRVKNNLQIISSLLNLQKNSTNNNDSQYVIEETQNRIQAIALVHQKLYQSKNIGKVDFGGYLKELMQFQEHIYGSKTNTTKINLNIPPNTLIDLDIAVSLGLIASELITNAYKYAFKNNPSPTLDITLTNNSNGTKKLLIKDNGKGLPENILNRTSETLGMELIFILAEQINGKIVLKNDNGACFKITFC